MVFDRNYEDSYSAPGSFVSRRSPLGTSVLAQIAGTDSEGRPTRSMLLQVHIPIFVIWLMYMS